MTNIIRHNPLFGKRIAITRPLAQSEEFVEALQARGATPVVFPTIQIMPLADPAPLDAILRRLPDYDWVVFTSVNGVSATMERLQATGLGTETLNKCRIAAIGPVTANSLHEHGVRVDCVPEEYVAEALIGTITGQANGSVAGQRFLLLRAETARPVLREQLITLGAQADEIPVYRTGCGAPEPDAYADLRAGVDAITFTSSSTVHCFCELLGKEAASIAAKATIACIGPITAGTAHERNLRVDLVASEYTVPGLIAVLENWFAIPAMTA
jgi:uroporphyrinogen-III synthase